MGVEDGETARQQASGEKLQALDSPSRVVRLDAKTTKKKADAPIGGLIVLSQMRTVDGDAWSKEAEDDLKAAFALSRRVCTLLGESAVGGGALFGQFVLMGMFAVTFGFNPTDEWLILSPVTAYPALHFQFDRSLGGWIFWGMNFGTFLFLCAGFYFLSARYFAKKHMTER